MYQIYQENETVVIISEDENGEEGNKTVINIADYAAATDKMVLVADAIGLSIDSKIVDKADELLYDLTEKV